MKCTWLVALLALSACCAKPKHHDYMTKRPWHCTEYHQYAVNQGVVIHGKLVPTPTSHRDCVNWTQD